MLRIKIPHYDPVTGAMTMETSSDTIDTKTRQRYLRELERSGSVLGQSIPSTIVIDDATIPVRVRIRALRRLDPTGTKQLETGTELASALMVRLDEIKNALREADLGRTQAEALVDEGLGLRRALATIRSILDPEEVDWEARSRAEEIEDVRRWIEYMRKVG